MNILVYIPELNQTFGGVRQYSVALLNLLAHDATNSYFVYHNNKDIEVMKVLGKNPQLQIVMDSDVKIKKENVVEKYWKWKNRIAKYLKIGKIRQKTPFFDILCEQFSIDIIHCPYQYIPHSQKVKLITTLHDVQEIHFPEYFTAENRAYRANAYLDFLRRADGVIVSYNHVKDDLIKYFSVPAEKINVLLLNMGNLWFNKFAYTDVVDLSKFNFPANYLLYPANTWKHKNHLRLIEAVAMARDKHQIEINVICTGHKNQHFDEIDNLLEKFNLQKNILFTDIVTEQELYSLYKKCRGVVIPTTYEAGSFPLYESILLDRPVICSNVTSLPETIGSDEFTFNPFDIDEMANKMIALWTDDDFLEKNLRQIKLQAEKIKVNNPLPVIQSIYKQLEDSNA